MTDEAQWRAATWAGFALTLVYDAAHPGTWLPCLLCGIGWCLFLISIRIVLLLVQYMHMKNKRRKRAS